MPQVSQEKIPTPLELRIIAACMTGFNGEYMQAAPILEGDIIDYKRGGMELAFPTAWYARQWELEGPR